MRLTGECSNRRTPSAAAAAARQGQVERVQVAGAHVDHAAAVTVGADDLVHLLRLQQAQFVAVAEGSSSALSSAKPSR